MLDRLEKKHIRSFNLILVIVLGISLGYLFASAFDLYLNRQALSPEAPLSRKRAFTSQATLQTYQPILKNNLFDPAGRNVVGSGELKGGSDKSREASASRTEMLLLGTVTSEKRPFAVIQIRGNEQIFHLNEEMPGGGKLEEISREEVRVRDQDGALYTLTLPKTTFSAPGPRTATPGRGTEGIREVGENRWIISGAEAQKARENMGEIFKHARVEAQKVNGQIEGFRVKMIRPRTLLWKLGLKRGDIIKEINGVQLDSDEKALQIFQQLKEARNITIALQRRGKNLTFEYEVE